MLTRENIICCVSSILIIAYMVVTFIMSNNQAAAATAPAANPVVIDIRGSEANPFVTKSEVERLIAPSLPERGKPIVASDINTLQLETLLNGIDNIEWARCSRTSADRLLVEVIPMKPVARVFDGDSSYYVNRQGKRLTASLRYRSDVPVIQGHLTGTPDVLRLLPLIDSIAARQELSQLITSISVSPEGDAILIPSIRGHVINFGAPDKEIANKFDRLLTMYRDVMPVKGWDYYDTLSVKFGHQIVATRRYPKHKPPIFIPDPDGDAAEDTMLGSMLEKPDADLSEEAPTDNPEAADDPSQQPVNVIQQ